MSQECRLEDCPRIGTGYRTATGKLELVHSLLKKTQGQGTPLDPKRSSMFLTDCLPDLDLSLFVIILAICLTVIASKMYVNLKAERHSTLIALGELIWMDECEKGMIRYQGPLVVL